MKIHLMFIHRYHPQLIVMLYNDLEAFQFNPYYLGNLTYLTARVRAEMFAASETLTWRCLEEIPVINGWILAGE